MCESLTVLTVSFAAISTTTMATCHTIYDMACRSEYVKPLRKEINEVLQEDGYDVDGEGFLKLKKPSLSKLRKLDSFIKESQRISPTAMGMYSVQIPSNSRHSYRI